MSCGMRAYDECLSHDALDHGIWLYEDTVHCKTLGVDGTDF